MCACAHVAVCVNRQMRGDENKLGNEASAAWQISRSYAGLDGYPSVALDACLCLLLQPYEAWTFRVRPFLLSESIWVSFRY